MARMAETQGQRGQSSSLVGEIASDGKAEQRVARNEHRRTHRDHAAHESSDEGLGRSRSDQMWTSAIAAADSLFPFASSSRLDRISVRIPANVALLPLPLRSLPSLAASLTSLIRSSASSTLVAFLHVLSSPTPLLSLSNPSWNSMTSPIRLDSGRLSTINSPRPTPSPERRSRPPLTREPSPLPRRRTLSSRSRPRTLVSVRQTPRGRVPRPSS